MTIRESLHKMKHDGDPKQAVLDSIGDISGRRLAGHQVLIATYIRPNVLQSGMVISEDVRTEDVYQGKVGLIVKMGPLAFSELGPAWDSENTPKIGDWVVYRPMDGFMTQHNGHPCRTLEDKQIREILDHPDIVI